MAEKSGKIQVRDSPPLLFQPISFRSVTSRNRIAVSPMCQYSGNEGLPNDWHLVHLGSRAVGGAGIVFTEATAVEPRGRITYQCLGLWNDEQAEAFSRITAFLSAQGAVPAIQLAHGGRKASAKRPWEGGAPLGPDQGGWQTIAPSPLPYAKGHPLPLEMTRDHMKEVVKAFGDAAARAVKAGFKIIELHAAHGYLLHEFLSPLSNRRTDQYGGDLANRARLLMETVDAIRANWPAELPLFIRLSCSDWVEGGWDLEQTVELVKMLKARGDVDLIDCSSGGNDPRQKLPLHPGYQVPFADTVRRETGIATGAVGLIRGARQAEEILANGRADLVLIARMLLTEPYWPMSAGATMGHDLPLPDPYQRANIKF